MKTRMNVLGFALLAGMWSVSLYAGAPYGDPNQPYDKLPGTVETYHVKWATPLPDGKLKVLCIIPYHSAREVVELRQRLDLDYTVIMNTGKSSWWEGYVEGADASPLDGGQWILDKLSRERLDLAKKYDAIIISKVSWEAIPKEIKELILKHVERGTALVYVSPHRTQASWREEKPEETTPDATYAGLFAANTIGAVGQAIFDSLPMDVIPLKVVADDAEFKKLAPPPTVPVGFNTPAQQAVTIRGTQHGKGKVVVLDYHDKGGRQGCYNSLTPRVFYDPMMYDYAYAVLAKCVVWAVKGEPLVKASVVIEAPASTLMPPVLEKPLPAGWDRKTPAKVITREDLGKAKVVVKAKTGAQEKQGLMMETAIRDRLGEVVKKEQIKAEIEAGGETAKEFALPLLDRGDYVLDCRLLDSKGAVLDFASKSFRVESGMQVAKVGTDKDKYEKGEKIQGKVTFAQPMADSQRAEAWAKDTWGRIVCKAPVTVDPGKTTGSFAIPVERPLCRLWDIGVTVSDKDGAVDSATVWVGLPDWTFDEYFMPLIFTSMPGDGWKGDLYTKQVRKYGVNSANVSLIYGFTNQYETFERAHLWGVTYAEHMGENGLCTGQQYAFQGAYDKECTSNATAELSRMIRTVVETGQPIDTKKYPETTGQWNMGGAWINGRMKDYREMLKFGTPYCFLTGENYLSGEFRCQENTGFTPLCASNFQAWCKGVYKNDLAVLNAEWGSQFKSWDEVRGIMIRDAVEQNQLPRWVAFRYFMRSKVWSQFFIDWTEMMWKTLGYEMRTGYNGHDHHDISRYRKAMTSGKMYVGQELNVEYRQCVSEELHESFSGDESFLLCAQSMMMLNYDFKTPLNNHRWPWKALFMGYRGFDWEAGAAQSVSLGGMSCMTPDYSEPTAFFKNISDQVLYLQRGIGKLCNTSKPVRSPVAIVWSLPNHYISRLFPFQSNGFSGSWLYNLSVDSGAIGDIVVLMKNLRMRPTFIAPEDLVDGALEKRGFKALILVYNKGMSDAEAAVIRDFVNKGGVVIADNEPGILTQFGKKREKSVVSDLFPIMDKRHMEFVGKGVAVYLPEVINGYTGRMEKGDYAGTDSIEMILRKYAGVTPAVELIDGNGVPRRDTLMPVWQKGSLRLVGMLRASTSEGKEADATTVKLDRAYHVWDVRASTYVGYTNGFAMNLDLYPKLYALMPANPDNMKMKIDPVQAKPGDKVSVGVELSMKEGEDAASINTLAQVVHVEVIGPDGRELEWYRDNVLFDGAKAEIVLPISYSEKPGKYTVKTEYPLTGLKGEASFDVR